MLQDDTSSLRSSDDSQDDPLRIHNWISDQYRFALTEAASSSRVNIHARSDSDSSAPAIRADSPLLGFPTADNASNDPLHFPCSTYVRDLPVDDDTDPVLPPEDIPLSAGRDKPLPLPPAQTASLMSLAPPISSGPFSTSPSPTPSSAPSPTSSLAGHSGHVASHSVIPLPPSFTRLPFHPVSPTRTHSPSSSTHSRSSQQNGPTYFVQPQFLSQSHTRSTSALTVSPSKTLTRRPSIARQPSLPLLGETFPLDSTPSVFARPSPLSISSVPLPSRSRSHSTTSLTSRVPVQQHSPLPPLASPTRRQSSARLLSTSSTLSQSSEVTRASLALTPASPPSVRNAVYLDSEEIREKLDEFLSIASASETSLAVSNDHDENTVTHGYDIDDILAEDAVVAHEDLFDFRTVHARGSSSDVQSRVSFSDDQNIVHSSDAHTRSSSRETHAIVPQPGHVPPNTPMTAYYRTPYASSSQVFLGNIDSVISLIPDAIPPTDLPTISVLADAAPIRPSPAPMLIMDTSSDEGSPMFDNSTPGTSPAASLGNVGPYGTTVYDYSEDLEGYRGNLAPPSMSRWSLTSSTVDLSTGSSRGDDKRDDKARKRKSLLGKSVKELKPKSSVVKDGKNQKEPKDAKEGKDAKGGKRKRLVSFISRLSLASPALPVAGVWDLPPPTPSLNSLQSSNPGSNSAPPLSISVSEPQSSPTPSSLPSPTLPSTPAASTPTLSTPLDTIPRTESFEDDLSDWSMASKRPIVHNHSSSQGSNLSSNAPQTRTLRSFSENSIHKQNSNPGPFGPARTFSQGSIHAQPQVQNPYLNSPIDSSIFNSAVVPSNHPPTSLASGRNAITGSPTRLKPMSSLGSLTSAAKAQSGRSGLRGLAARMGLVSDTVNVLEEESIANGGELSGEWDWPQTKGNDWPGRKNKAKRKLVITGIENDDLSSYEAIRAWCESFGEVRQMIRAPSGCLHVDFKKASVAETVCRLQAQVYIKGAGSVNLSWHAKKGTL